METPQHAAAILRSGSIETTIEALERSVEALRTAEREIWTALRDNRTAQNVLCDRRAALNTDLESAYAEIDFYAGQAREARSAALAADLEALDAQNTSDTLDAMAAEESWTSVDTSI